MFQAFGVLDRDELQADTSYGPFPLPEETQRLTLATASDGVYASLQDYPQLETSEAALEVRAKQLAELRVRIRHDISNDREMYARLFVPALVFGYRLGQAMYQETSRAEQTKLLQGVCSMDTPTAHLFIERWQTGKEPANDSWSNMQYRAISQVAKLPCLPVGSNDFYLPTTQLSDL